MQKEPIIIDTPQKLYATFGKEMEYIDFESMSMAVQSVGTTIKRLPHSMFKCTRWGMYPSTPDDTTMPYWVDHNYNKTCRYCGLPNCELSDLLSTFCHIFSFAENEHLTIDVQKKQILFRRDDILINQYDISSRTMFRFFEQVQEEEFEQADNRDIELGVRKLANRVWNRKVLLMHNLDIIYYIKEAEVTDKKKNSFTQFKDKNKRRFRWT